MFDEVGDTVTSNIVNTTDYSLLYTILIIISNILTLFLIFIVIFKSTADVKLYKYVLLKLAICDLLFNICLSLLVGPDMLCPLPAAAIRSPIGGLSELNAFITVSITLTLAVALLSSINDCCFIRICIFYQWNKLLQKIYSWRGGLFLIVFNISFASLIVIGLSLSSTTNQEFLTSIKIENKTHLLGSYAFQSDVVYFNIDIWKSPQFIPLISTVIFILASIHIFNLSASRILWKEIGKRKNNMSDRSYLNHKQLTMFVLCQNLYPPTAIAIPVFLIILSLVLNYELDTFAQLIKHIVTLLIVLYPMMTVVSSFLFIIPYRQYLISLMCQISLRRISPQIKISNVAVRRCDSLGRVSFDSTGWL